MTSDDSKIREVLENGLDSLQVLGVIPETLLRRAKRRRIATSLVSGALATIVFVGAVYGASALTNNERVETPPAQSPRICSPEEVDIVTDISDPVGTGEGHYGVLFEVRITPHNSTCEPTLYIELDDSPVLPPDHEGPDADEFRFAAENPCLRADRAAGDFLYAGKSTIEVGTGCDPADSPPHETQETIRFDGKTHEQIDDTEKTADEYPLLVENETTKVFAPSSGQSFGWCPTDGEPLTAEDLGPAQDAVLLAAESINNGLDAHDAYANSALASEEAGPPDFAAMITEDCPPSLVERTALVTLHLPRVESASMGATTYFVVRESRGWVIWNAW